MKSRELKPNEICLGNIIECMGKAEVVTGIIQDGKNLFQIGHTGWNAGINVIPHYINFSSLAIPLTEEWKKCLGIEKFEGLPKWIEYVHQAQNYFKWALDVDLLQTMNWDLLPELEID